MASGPLPMVQEQPGTGLAGMDPAEINMQRSMQYKNSTKYANI